MVILLNSLDRISKEDQLLELEFGDPWKELLAKWRAGAFVDDANQGILDALGTLNIEELVEQLQQVG